MVGLRARSGWRSIAMTVFKKVVRVQTPRENLLNWSMKPGLEMVVHPYKPEEVEDTFDVMFRTSDLNPCLSERLLMDDIDNEVERLKLLYGGKSKEERLRDSDFHNYETYMDFQDFADSAQLKDLDKFKSKSITQWGDKNKVAESPNDTALNEAYIKAKKEYLLMIDRG
jgi:hypothetical protein